MDFDLIHINPVQNFTFHWTSPLCINLLFCNTRPCVFFPVVRLVHLSVFSTTYVCQAGRILNAIGVDLVTNVPRIFRGGTAES
jgi:hypothetical protein